MAISGKIAALPGVAEAVVVMASASNKELLAGVGLLTEAVAAGDANDLVIAVRAADDAVAGQALAVADGMLGKQVAEQKSAARFATLQSAVRSLPAANLAIVSVPGEFAAREAKAALEAGLHVMMFSDNVSLDDEIKLKEYAHRQGLLLMGPDCGTAIINNVGLCFANAVAGGDIGVIGASGTGTQEITVLIDRLGGGLSQVLGTGGRDLSAAVGGIMMLDCLAALAADAATRIIVLVSKPPAPAVAAKILAAAENCGKPVVVCFLGGDAAATPPPGIYFARTLEDAARAAVALAKGQQPAAGFCQHPALATLAAAAKAKLAPGQRAVRGLFCGGTLCQEAKYIIGGQGGGEHRFLDLGDDAYTVGKPHPMLEPALRLPYILQQAEDPAVAVLLLDVVLGYGAHADPAGVTAPAIAAAKETARRAGRHLEVIAYTCGTEADRQQRSAQEAKLAAAGACLAKSNARAAYLAAAIVS
jgi:succinyl-CoA synthetase alpha subunit